jgi:type II secretory pathway component PulF
MFERGIGTKDKILLIEYFQSVLSNGFPLGKAIDGMVKRFKSKTGKNHVVKILQKIVDSIEQGSKFSDALENSGFLDKNESMILKKSKTLVDGLEKIKNQKGSSAKITAAILFLLVPPLIAITVLFATQPMVAGILNDMMAPLAAAGAKPPELPPYLASRKIYGMWMILVYGVIAGYFGLLFSLKKTSTKLYYQMMPIEEQKYTSDILYSIYSLREIGISLSESVSILYESEPDVLKKRVYGDMKTELEKGGTNISNVMRKHGTNETTVFLLELGEDSKNTKKAFFGAYDEVSKRFKRNVSILFDTSKFMGQVAMMGIVIKPITDILLLTSVEQMNFSM